MPTLDFKGKHYVYAHHFSTPFRTLSVDVDKSLSHAQRLDDNLVIHGDNLQRLKAPLSQYAGKIKWK
jgi:adenine-specific DNA-methyltransferase